MSQGPPSQGLLIPSWHYPPVIKFGNENSPIHTYIMFINLSPLNFPFLARFPIATSDFRRVCPPLYLLPLSQVSATCTSRRCIRLLTPNLGMFVWALEHHLFVRSFVLSFLRSFVPSFLRSFVRSFVCSFVCLCVCVFVCLFVCLF